MRATSDATPLRRKVFYIPGYDPFPARRYRELYRKEGAAQASLSGYDLRMIGGFEGDGYGWRVQTDIDGWRSETDFEVLIWSDIVQQSFDKRILATYLALLHTAWIYLSTGAFWRLMRLRKGPVITALYPVAILVAQLLIALLVAYFGITFLMRALHLTSPPFFTDLMLPRLAATVMFVAITWGVLNLFKRADHHFFAYYLMHDFAFSASRRGAYPEPLSNRLDIFAQRISNALQTGVDEVLVVGHSSGAHLAVSSLATVLRDPAAEGTQKISFLSLGQVMPMISFLPQAHALRRDLRDLSTRADLTWIDVTAPGDGCCFALCDPVGLSGQAHAEQRWPLVISAAFTQSLSPARWHALRWRFFRLHFQYLCAFDHPKDYDYFQITAGPLSLAARFEGRPPSSSRLTDAMSKYTSIHP